MSRPRTVADGDILLGAGRVISRVGPTRFTLADVGKAVGLSPGALVKRFGSRRGLLLALSRHSSESVDACFAAIRSANPDPFDAIVAAALEMTRYVETPAEVANHLAFFQIDLSDPDFYALMRDSHTRIEDGYRALLREAVAAGDLIKCDTARLARAVSAMATGSLLGWAVGRRGSAESWVRRDLMTLLSRYRQNSAMSPRQRRRNPVPRRS